MHKVIYCVEMNEPETPRLVSCSHGTDWFDGPNYCSLPCIGNGSGTGSCCVSVTGMMEMVSLSRLKLVDKETVERRTSRFFINF